MYSSKDIIKAFEKRISKELNDSYSVYDSATRESTGNLICLAWNKDKHRTEIIEYDEYESKLNIIAKTELVANTFNELFSELQIK